MWGSLRLAPIIRTMNTKHERCGMAFLLQTAHKIAVSCPKYVYCMLLRQIKSFSNTVGPFSLREMAVIFTASSDMAMLFSPSGCTNPPQPTYYYLCCGWQKNRIKKCTEVMVFTPSVLKKNLSGNIAHYSWYSSKFHTFRQEFEHDNRNAVFSNYCNSEDRIVMTQMAITPWTADNLHAHQFTILTSL